MNDDNETPRGKAPLYYILLLGAFIQALLVGLVVDKILWNTNSHDPKQVLIFFGTYIAFSQLGFIYSFVKIYKADFSNRVELYPSITSACVVSGIGQIFPILLLVLCRRIPNGYLFLNGLIVLTLSFLALHISKYRILRNISKAERTDKREHRSNSNIALWSILFIIAVMLSASIAFLCIPEYMGELGLSSYDVISDVLEEPYEPSIYVHASIDEDNAESHYFPFSQISLISRWFLPIFVYSIVFGLVLAGVRILMPGLFIGNTSSIVFAAFALTAIAGTYPTFRIYKHAKSAPLYEAVRSAEPSELSVEVLYGYFHGTNQVLVFGTREVIDWKKLGLRKHRKHTRFDDQPLYRFDYPERHIYVCLSEEEMQEIADMIVKYSFMDLSPYLFGLSYDGNEEHILVRAKGVEHVVHHYFRGDLDFSGFYYQLLDIANKKVDLEKWDSTFSKTVLGRFMSTESQEAALDSLELLNRMYTDIGPKYYDVMYRHKRGEDGYRGQLVSRMRRWIGERKETYLSRRTRIYENILQRWNLASKIVEAGGIETYYKLLMESNNE